MPQVLKGKEPSPDLKRVRLWGAQWGNGVSRDSACSGIGAAVRFRCRNSKRWTTVPADRHWNILDTSHYDLNTCPRESVVILKRFLQALPQD